MSCLIILEKEIQYVLARHLNIQLVLQDTKALRELSSIVTFFVDFFI